ncbi:murein biosynthesis integral membrane protein MurJ [Actinokineospora globicatena]|uniref:murein biosynthesis integral membrane protein MurJ n=1 Tax=Actinokineospora globicatena TaxID=103729 RepID=UPI0020A5CEEA|nr:murein biosynthesis integral membrane protein MurJ [Actinokineospora globicatena]MCP2301268.1 putative peptidoglycan lipid II flippase [Actinokineospora globicatena]
MDGTATVAKDEPAGGSTPSLAKASGSMAIATLVSRITGFGWKLVMTWLIGINVTTDSFTIANTLPNIIFELLLGGVLASIVVPLLVRSQDDPDGGNEYTSRLLTVGMTGLAIGTVIAVAAAPLFTTIYVDGTTGKANPDLVTAFAYLLLPEILFYGLFALLSAILQAKHVFGPTAWAPVVNNVVILATLVAFWLMPGEISLDPVRMGDPKLLVLGLGTTLGIVVQAAVLVPALRRSGFRFRWTWGIDARLREFGGLALWILGYVGISQIGMVITQRVLTAAAVGGVSIYSNAWLLFQLPYGVIGVSLLTAILPRMSKAAAVGDTQRLVDDLSTGSRLSAVMLVPISAVLTITGAALCVALFGVGEGGIEQSQRLGHALAFSAFGLLPYALVMLQLRVFYAMKDARTPTLIMVVMTAVKVPLLYMCGALVRPDQVVIAVLLVNSLTFVVGAVLGQMWLWVRLGNLHSKKVVKVIAVCVLASGVGAAAAWGLSTVALPTVDSVTTAWVNLAVQGPVACVVAFGVLVALKVPELKPATSRITRLVRRG